MCHIHPIYAFFYWNCTSVQTFRAIGPLFMEILHFKDLGDTSVISIIMLLAHLLLKQFCNCKCACTMYLYVASVLMYLNVIHDFMEGGTFECFNMWDSNLNIRMFSLLGGGGQGKHAPISRNVHGRFFPFKCWWAPMQNTTLIQYVMCQSYNYPGMGFTCYVVNSNAPKCLLQTVTKCIVSIDVSIYLFGLWSYYPLTLCLLYMGWFVGV